MPFIPLQIVLLIITLIGLILLSIFSDKLKLKTVTVIEYILVIITIIAIFILCLLH